MNKLLLSIALVFALTASASAKTYEFSFAHTYPNTHVLTKWLEGWAARLATDTNNQLQVHMFPNSSLVKTDEMPAAVKNGGVEMAIVGNNAPETLPHISLFGMPFLVKDAEHGTKLAMALQETSECRQDYEKLGVPMISWSSTIACLASTGDPVRHPKDLAGKRVIVWFPTQVEEVKSWGGVPILTPIQDTYVALQRGMGEVIYCQIPPVTNMKLNELVKYVTPIPSQTMVSAIIVNKAAYDELPKDLQEKLRQSLNYETAMSISKQIEADGQRTLTICRDGGIEVISLTPEQLAPFKGAAMAAQKPYFLDILRYAKVPDAEAWYNKVITLSDSID